LVAVRVRAESSVGDAAYIDLVVAGDEELAVNRRAVPADRFGRYRRRHRRAEWRTHAGRALPSGVGRSHFQQLVVVHQCSSTFTMNVVTISRTTVETCISQRTERSSLALPNWRDQRMASSTRRQCR